MGRHLTVLRHLKKVFKFIGLTMILSNFVKIDAHYFLDVYFTWSYIVDVY